MMMMMHDEIQTSKPPNVKKSDTKIKKIIKIIIII